MYIFVKQTTVSTCLRHAFDSLTFYDAYDVAKRRIDLSVELHSLKKLTCIYNSSLPVIHMIFEGRKHFFLKVFNPNIKLYFVFPFVFILAINHDDTCLATITQL